MSSGKELRYGARESSDGTYESSEGSNEPSDGLNEPSHEAYGSSLSVLYVDLKRLIQDSISEDGCGWARNRLDTAFQLHNIQLQLAHWLTDIGYHDHQPLSMIEIDSKVFASVIRTNLVFAQMHVRKLRAFLQKSANNSTGVDVEFETALVEGIRTCVKGLQQQVEPLQTFLNARKGAGIPGAIERAVNTMPPEVRDVAVMDSGSSKTQGMSHDEKVMGHEGQIEAHDTTKPRAIDTSVIDLIQQSALIDCDYDDVNSAIKSAQQAVDDASPDHPERFAYLGKLGACFAIRFETTGETTDLTKAIEITLDALESAPPQNPHRSFLLGNLGNLFKARFTQTNEGADLDKAISMTEEAISTSPRNLLNSSFYLSNLGSLLGTRFARMRNMADLEEAIRASKAGLNITRIDHPSIFRRLSNLEALIRDKFARTGTRADLENTIETAEKAIGYILPDDPNISLFLSSLGKSLGDRYKRTGSTEDLERAVVVAQRAVADTPSTHPDKFKHLNSLSLRLMDKFEKTRDPEDLEAAIETMRLAFNEIPLGHYDRFECLNNLEGALRKRFALKGDMTDLQEAIATSQEALDAIPPNHMDRAACLNNIGHGLVARFAATGAKADLAMSYRHYVSAFNQVTSSIYERMKAASSLLSSPCLLQDSHNHFRYASQSIELLQHLTPRLLRNSDRQNLLLKAAGLASDAAVIALTDQRSPTMALSWLETGCGVLASTLQGFRADLCALQEQHPRLALSFEAFRDILDLPTTCSRLISNEDREFSAGEETSKRMKAQQQFDQLLQEIRQQPGFDQFLLPPNAAEIQNAALHGPVVIVNISRHRCDALIIRQTDIQCVELSNVTYEETQKRRQCFSSLSYSTLEWLWDSIVHPILDRLGYSRASIDGDCPRIWWVPTGPLVGLPLHAAGYHLEEQGRTALDLVVSSYATSLLSIINTRQKQQWQRKDHDRGMLLVTMENTPGVDKFLSHAAEEIAAVRASRAPIRVYPEAPNKSKRHLRRFLKSCEIFHFAGCGNTNPHEPLQSLLLLEDWQDDPLTVESLIEINSQRSQPFLAYISACGTGRISDNPSIDENIHLTSAFQLAGFRHVIDTLWEVDDGLRVDIATLTYEFLGKNGLNDEAVSRGLHYATKTLRHRWVARQRGRAHTAESTRRGNRGGNELEAELESLHWVPYVHIGV